MYVCTGCTIDFVVSIVESHRGRISDTYHELCNVLGDSLCAMFPHPARSKMLCVYCIIHNDHVRNFLLLDAVEASGEKSSNNNVASATYSDYKKHTTVKLLAMCNPIGFVWYGIVPNGNSGKISHVVATAEQKFCTKFHLETHSRLTKVFLSTINQLPKL
ncbi:LOW QUALITY PROTEIN: hypothetical protein ACHAW6_009742 [Cyclotella cf. meneghiniana]